ncbi:MAG: DMT family transporter [Rhodospirillaceae bacterium]|nr:MAG: DMT family transporter [Rhodospirillaceae bacterium]
MSIANDANPSTATEPQKALATGGTQPAAIRHPQFADFALLCFLAFLWGSSFLAIKIAVDEGLPPMSLATYRIAIGAVVLCSLACAKGQAWPRGGGLWRRLIFLGIVGNSLPFFLIAWGEQYTPSNLAAILMAVIPIFVVVLAHLMTSDEKLTFGKSVGVGIALVGVVVLVGVDALKGIGQSVLGQLAILGATISYSVYGVNTRRLPSMGPEMTVGTILLMGFVSLLPVWLVHDRPWEIHHTRPAILVILWLGMVSTAFGNLLFFLIMRRVGVGFAAFNNYLVPVMGIGWGFFWLGEKPGWNALVALLMILGGLAATRFLTAPASWRRNVGRSS